MTGEERRDLVRLVLAKVEIDLRTGGAEGLIPKPAFAPLFRVLAEEEDGLISVCGWRPRGDSGPLGTAEALSHFARYVPYLATVGAYGVLVKR